MIIRLYLSFNPDRNNFAVYYKEEGTYVLLSMDGVNSDYDCEGLNKLMEYFYSMGKRPMLELLPPHIPPL